MQTTSYVLNELDQRTQTDYHNGTAVKQRFDAMGARTALIDQELPATSYSYDEVGNKLTLVDA